jgi:hypothetical protein
VLKGFIIFFTATFWPVSPSFAELRDYISIGGRIELVAEEDIAPNQTKSSHSNWLQVGISVQVKSAVPLSQNRVAYPARVPGSNLECRAKDLRSDEFGHSDLTARTEMFQSWSGSREWDVGKEGVVC